MKSALSVCAVLSLISIGPALADSAPAPIATTLPQLEQKLTDDCAAGRFSGVVIARKAGTIVFRHICGLANAADGKPVTEASRFKIFSISKSFTGTLIMVLADRGLIALDESARRYVPEMPEEWQQITVRQLLNHTSGIPDLTRKILDAYRANPADGYDAAMHHVLADISAEDKAIKGIPGTVFVYNNFGYELLARAIENVSHASYEKEITDTIFIPAGMKTAEIAKPKIEDGRLTGSQPSPGLAQGYNGQPGALEPATSLQFTQMGAGSIYASAADLLDFDSALSRGEIVSPKILDDCGMHAFVILPTVSYGCGWMWRKLKDETYFEHSGGNNGFATDFAREPQNGIAVIVMSNLGFAEPEDIRYALMTILLQSGSGP
jgi:CubicO group peptidase (beta-lactamase class C family)